MDPEVKDVVQIDVGQKRAYARPLWCPYFCLLPLLSLDDAGLEPLHNKAQYSSVGHAMGDHSQQPFMVNCIKEAANVRIQHVIHALRHQCSMECLECMVWAAPRAKPIRKPKKIDFVDRAEYFTHAALDDLILNR